MNNRETTGRENQPTRKGADARERESALRAAILRIGASLDLDTVLGEVVESARALTGATYGVIATVSRDGAPQDFVTSGLTAEQRQSLETWPDALRLFGHLHSLEAPLRLPDLDALVRSLDCSPFPVRCGAFQATPLHHREQAVGGFFLGGKEGGFTDADEERLVLFAQQAAAALSNARVHREEQRARADLEALVETCPVAVVVLDAETGVPLSLNREARRILAAVDVGGAFAGAGRACRWCAGAATAARLISAISSTAVPVRAEEVEISVPGGGSVRALLDATPIHVAGGGSGRTIGGDASGPGAVRGAGALAGGVPGPGEPRAAGAAGGDQGLGGDGAQRSARPGPGGGSRQYLRIVEEQADRMSGLIGDLLDAGLIGAGMLSVDPVPEDLAELVERARTAFTRPAAGATALSSTCRKTCPAPWRTRGASCRCWATSWTTPRVIRRKTSPIRVSARCDGTELEVSVADGGEGIPAARLHRLFRRHAGAGGDGRDGGGSGLGLVICRGLVEAHGGRIRAESAPGRGTRIVFTLPAAEAEAASAARVSRPVDGGRTPILVVDDDPHALRQARNALEAAGYATATTAEPGEVSPPGRDEKAPPWWCSTSCCRAADGIELMRTLPGLSDLPVILVSAYGGGDTIARALEAGAADYIVKPFSAAELAARVALALRRRTAPAPFRLGELTVDRVKRRVTLAGRPLRLTATEYRLLHALSLDAGGATTFASLQRRVWGEGKGNPDAVRSAIRKLRLKLGDDARDPTYIFGERGLGYRMPEPDSP